MNLRIDKNLWQQVLSFRPSVNDIPYFVQGGVIVFLFGRLFFDSFIAMVVLSPGIILWTILQKHIDKTRKRRAIGIQFRDAIYSVLTNLKAGYSIENAFVESQRDMELLYGAKSDIVYHLNIISKGLKNNIPLEKLIYGFGRECENTDIQDFAFVFRVAKRNGGNMTEIIERTIGVISQKINVEKEIDVLISAKRLEARIMNMVPFFIIFYISISSPGFFDVLYHNLFGIALMSVCMIVYVVAYLISEKIVNISV